jgi:hypothetical protein
VFGKKMITDDFIVEARARIIWGDEPASVRCFLTSNGMAAAEADAKIEELTLERNAEIRKLGIRDVLIGVVLMAAAIFFFYMLFARSHIPGQTVRSGKGYGVLAVAALYGLWRLVNGVIRLVRPKSEHGSIPDISE